MTDFFIRAPSKEHMHGAVRATYELLAGVVLEPDAPLPEQARTLMGTGWVYVDCGVFSERTGEFISDGSSIPIPVMAPREGWHGILRWNGGDEIPPVPDFIEIIWRSDAVDGEGNPVAPPAWWSQVLA